MAGQYTDRVAQRDVNDVDISKARAFMTAISQIQIKDYEVKVIITSKLKYFMFIKDKLNHKTRNLFRTSCFGEWLDIAYFDHERHMIDYMLQRQCYVNDAHYDMPLIYSVHGRGLHFGCREFSLITGLKITSLDLIGVIEDEEFFLKLCNKDVVRIWILESFERSNCWWSKDTEVILRGLAWLRKAIFKSFDFINLFCKVLVRKTNGGVVDKLEFSEDFPNLSTEFYDELNKDFLELFESHSCSSGSSYSDLDINEDADEFKMKLEEKEMLLFKQEKILKKESRLRLEEKARLMPEEEKLLEDENFFEKDYKKREFALMNSVHMK
nr:phospholipase-like protein [Tanacetum cinerariifolium]